MGLALAFILINLINLKIARVRDSKSKLHRMKAPISSSAQPQSASTYAYCIAFDDICHKSFQSAVLLTSLSVLVLIHIVNYYEGTKVWSQWTPDQDYVTYPTYPERVYWEDILRTRSNTWSNFFYVFVGYFAISAGLCDIFNARRHPTAQSNFLQRHPQLSFMFGLGCLHLGVGSGLYHASLTHLGRQIDVASMYTPLMGLISISISRWYPYLKLPMLEGKSIALVPSWPLFTLFTIFGVYIFFEYKWQMSSGLVLPLMIVLTYGLMILDRRYHPNRRMVLRWLIWSFASLIVAFVCRLLDVNRLFSGPDAMIQGHSVWHLLTSFTLYWAYVHQRTEPLSHIEPTGNAPIGGFDYRLINTAV